MSWQDESTLIEEPQQAVIPSWQEQSVSVESAEQRQAGRQVYDTFGGVLGGIPPTPVSVPTDQLDSSSVPVPQTYTQEADRYGVKQSTMDVMAKEHPELVTSDQRRVQTPEAWEKAKQLAEKIPLRFIKPTDIKDIPGELHQMVAQAYADRLAKNPDTQNFKERVGSAIIEAPMNIIDLSKFAANLTPEQTRFYRNLSQISAGERPDNPYAAYDPRGIALSALKMAPKAIYPPAMASLFAYEAGAEGYQKAKAEGGSTTRNLATAAADATATQILFSPVVGKLFGPVTKTAGWKQAVSQYAIESGRATATVGANAGAISIIDDFSSWAAGNAPPDVVKALATTGESALKSAPLMFVLHAPRGVAAAIAKLPPDASRAEFKEAGGPAITSIKYRKAAVEAAKSVTPPIPTQGETVNAEINQRPEINPETTPPVEARLPGDGLGGAGDRGGEEVAGKVEAPPEVPAQGEKNVGQREDQASSAGVAEPTVEPPLAEQPAAASEVSQPERATSFGSVFPIPPGVVEDLNAAAEGVSKAGKFIQQTFAPGGISAESKGMAGIVRENAAQLSLRHERAKDALNNFSKVIGKMPKQERYDFIDGVEAGSPQKTPELDRAALVMRGFLDQARDRIRALGKGQLDNFIQNYFPHIWKDPAKAEQVLGVGKRPLEGSKAFLKRRTIPTTKEGLTAGLEPVTDNPSELVLLKLHEMNRYEMAQKILQEGKDRGFIKLARTPKDHPDGWVKINDKIGTVWQRRPTTKASGEEGAPEFIHRGDYYAHPDAGRILNNYLSPGLRGNALYDAARYGSNLMNMAQLGLSAFHLTFTAFDSIVSQTALAGEQLARGKPLLAAKTGVSAWGAPITNFIKGDKVLREALRPGSQGGDLAQVVDALQAGGFRLRQDQFYRLGKESTSAWDSFVQALKSGRPSAVPKALSAALEQASRPMMEYLVPRMKLGVAVDLARFELEKLPPGASRAQLREAMGKVWDSVDNRMGQLVYDNLFWNKALKDSLMLSTRSLGWNLGTVRELGGGALDIAGAGKALLSGKKPELTHRAAYVVALPFATAILGAVTTYLYTGHGPQTLMDYIYPPTGTIGPDGEEKRIQFPNYMKDVIHFFKDPVTTVTNKVNPGLSSMIQMFQNKDFYGTQIRNPDDPLVKQMKDSAEFIGEQFVPFSLRGAMQEKKQGQSVGTQAAALFGINPAPASITKSPAQQLLRRYIGESMPQVRTHEQVAKTDLRRQIRDAFREGTGLNEIDWKGKIAPAEMKKLAKQAHTERLVSGIKQIPMSQALKVAEVTTGEEWKDIRPTLAKRYQNEYKRFLGRQVSRDEWFKVRDQYRELRKLREKK